MRHFVRTFSAVLFLVTAMLLADLTAWPSASTAGIAPESGQRLAALFQPGNASQAGRRYGLVILNEWNHEWIPLLKAADPSVRVLLYKNTFFLRGDDNASTVGGFGAGESIDTRHPDWFLKDGSGQRIVFQYYEEVDFYAMDWGHPEWREYWADRAVRRATALGFDGLFLDDLYTRSWGTISGPLDRYVDDLQLQSAVRGFLATVHARVKARDPDLLVVGNVVDHLEAPDLFEDWLTISDGLMDEQFVHTGAHSESGFKSLGDKWEQQLAQVETAERMGKAAVFVSHGAAGDSETMLFTYATYMLAADGASYYSHVHDGSMDDPTWYGVWGRDLGAALGPYRVTPEGVYTRAFSKGMVAVNPRSTGELTLEVRGYRDSHGAAVRTITLGPHSAAILHRRVDARRLIFETVPAAGWPRRQVPR
ncbi:MAG: putative glycoside hydrolase family 15 protein [Actinobacteria bacterium]|nr:putative glycoside hydrolase family 15 protein [Actinomycetota bacterium]